MFGGYKIFLYIIRDRRIKGGRFSFVSSASDTRQIGLRVVLIAIAKVLGHLDILDIFWQIERLKDGICKSVPCVHSARPDVEQSPDLLFQKAATSDG